MKIILTLLLIAGYSYADNLDNTVAQKCMNIAKNYASEHYGQPWSSDANFVKSYDDTCIVRVTQTCEQAPYETYNKSYVINLQTSTVNYFEIDGCVNSP